MIDDKLVRLRRSGISGQKLHVASTCPMQFLKRPSTSQTEVGAGQGPIQPTVHTQQSSVPNGVAEHNVTVARAFTKLMGAFVTFWDNDALRCSWAACSTLTTP